MDFYILISRITNDTTHIGFSLILDELVKSQKASVIVIPAKAGIQGNQPLLDSRVRGSDGFGDFLRSHYSL